MNVETMIAPLKQSTLQEANYLLVKTNTGCKIAKEGRNLAFIAMTTGRTEKELPVGIMIENNSYHFFTKILEIYYDEKEKRLRISYLDLEGKRHWILESEESVFHKELSYNPQL